MALAQTARAQAIYAVTKTALYDQAGVGVVAPDPGAAYIFLVECPLADSLGVPNASSPVSLTFVAVDNDFELQAVFATKSAMDLRYPSGTYVFSGPAEPTVNIALNGDLYPPTPQVTNGTWNSAGQLVLDPAQTNFVNLSAFPGYSTSGIFG